MTTKHLPPRGEAPCPDCSYDVPPTTAPTHDALASIAELTTDQLKRYRRVAREAQATYVGRHWPSMDEMRRDGIGSGLVDKPAHEARIRRYLDTFQPEMLVEMLDAWLAERATRKLADTSAAS